MVLTSIIAFAVATAALQDSKLSPYKWDLSEYYASGQEVQRDVALVEDGTKKLRSIES